MAKETAHQLGTPISSMMGWVDLLEAETAPDDESTRGTLREMRTDIARLEQVAHRVAGARDHPQGLARAQAAADADDDHVLGVEGRAAERAADFDQRRQRSAARERAHGAEEFAS